MKQYKNLGVSSGVRAYELGPDYIIILFKGDWYYLYTTDSASAGDITIMQQLAEKGRGLGTYINAHVKDGYAYKSKTKPVVDSAQQIA
jgi:hypothetical protein